MEYSAFTPNSTTKGNFGTDTAMEMDFMDELLFEGCWLETTGVFNHLPPGSLTSMLSMTLHLIICLLWTLTVLAILISTIISKYFK